MCRSCNYAKAPTFIGRGALLALYVSDIEKARGFYRDWLGFQEPYELKNTDGSLSLTFLKINDDQYIEIFPGLKPEQDRLNHISFQTDNAEALRAYLAARGVKVPDKVNKVRIGNTSFQPIPKTLMTTPSNSRSTNPAAGLGARRANFFPTSAFPRG
ncbi:MAG: VOC family protein [Blastocatellia bacterium]